MDYKYNPHNYKRDYFKQRVTFFVLMDFMNYYIQISITFLRNETLFKNLNENKYSDHKQNIFFKKRFPQKARLILL